MTDKVIPGPGMRKQPELIQLTDDDFTDVKCSNCGGVVFAPVYAIKRMSPLHVHYNTFVAQNNGDTVSTPVDMMCIACSTPLRSQIETEIPDDYQECDCGDECDCKKEEKTLADELDEMNSILEEE